VPWLQNSGFQWLANSTQVKDEDVQLPYSGQILQVAHCSLQQQRPRLFAEAAALVVASLGKARMRRLASKRDQRSRQAGLCPVQEKPHAQRLGPLDGHQPHMPADVVAIGQIHHLHFVELGVFFQPGNPIFNGLAKPWADLKTFADSTVGHHGLLLDENLLPFPRRIPG